MAFYKTGYGANKTEETGLIWAQHLASLLIDSVYAASIAWSNLRRTNSIPSDTFWAFMTNFKELYESTKEYMPSEELNKLGINNMLILHWQDKTLTLSNIASLITAFFEYNDLIHKSQIMRIIEQIKYINPPDKDVTRN